MKRHKGEIFMILLLQENIVFYLFSRTEVSAFIFVIFYSQIIIRPDSVFKKIIILGRQADVYLQRKHHKRFPVGKGMCLTASNVCPRPG